jgi:glucokinase
VNPTTPQSSQENRFQLVGDVGGTFARFALHDRGADRIASPQTLRCDDYPDLAAAVEHYLSCTGAPRPPRAAIAVACTVTDDQVEFTNRDWSFSIESTRQRLGMDNLVVLNDFHALALSLPLLDGEHLITVGGGEPAREAPRALVGPGSGLGVSLLVPIPGGGHVAVPAEGGHATFAAQDARERAVVELLQKEHNGHVSCERMVSGIGLKCIYHALCVLDGVTELPLAPADIVDRARASSCPQSVETVDMFCAALGTVAGNVALITGARGGVYIGGGIVPKLGALFARSRFRDRFEAKGRYTGFMQSIPTYVIRHPHPALLGAASALAPARN